MKASTAVCCLLTAILPGLLAADEPADQARAAIAAFAGALKNELSSAMQAGGPLNAIEVCNTRASAIAEAISLEQGMTLSRVSLRNRNPGNAPNDWQTTVLRQFEQLKQAGEPADALIWSETVATPGGEQFRFMKAIPTAPMCLTCHGQDLAPAVAAKIAELYPADQATGFRQGDIRGAFVVTQGH